MVRVEVVGNGESIYFASDDKDGSILGVNKSTCSDITVYIENREVKRVKFLVQPNNSFYPLNKISKEDLILRGFLWEANRRPIVPKDIFKSTPIENEDSSNGRYHQRQL